MPNFKVAELNLIILECSHVEPTLETVQIMRELKSNLLADITPFHTSNLIYHASSYKHK